MRFQPFSGLLSLARPAALAPLFVAFGGLGACGEGDPDSEVDRATHAEDPWGVRQAGGAPPLYGEADGLMASELRLKFESLNAMPVGGGTDLVFLPDERGILMTLREGRIAHLRLADAQLLLQDVWDFEEEMLPIKACSPTNILLDPDFVDNRYIYVTYCKDPFVTRLVRYVWEPGAAPRNPAVIFETEIAEHEDDGEWHRFGSMGWEEDGVLWFFIGDHKQEHLAQDPTSPHAGLHRIIPNREPDGSGYVPAPGNMASASPDGDVHDSLYAYGLRSPWRGTRDRSGRFIVGDVGLETIEEVNLIDAVGLNFGWDLHEGPCQADCDGLTDPVVSYSREPDHPYVFEDNQTTENGLRAIWVGEIYEQPVVDRYQGLMDGVVPFGDLFTGWVRALKLNAAGEVTMDQSVGHLTNVTQWKVAPDGYAYVLDLGGQVYVALLEGG